MFIISLRFDYFPAQTYKYSKYFEQSFSKANNTQTPKATRKILFDIQNSDERKKKRNYHEMVFKANAIESLGNWQNYRFLNTMYIFIFLIRTSNTNIWYFKFHVILFPWGEKRQFNICIAELPGIGTM